MDSYQKSEKSTGRCGRATFGFGGTPHKRAAVQGIFAMPVDFIDEIEFVLPK